MGLKTTVPAIGRYGTTYVFKQFMSFQKFVCFLKFFCVPYWLPVFFLFSIMNQIWVQESILEWLWHHFHLALDGDQTHDLPIMSLVLYRKTTALVTNYFKSLLDIDNFKSTKVNSMKFFGGHICYN